MKRYNNLFYQIVNKENLELADAHARKNKHNWGIKKHDKHKESDIEKLLESLLNLTYHTSKYNTFTIYEPKERLIFRLPYYPDRIVHHAIMNIMEPIWTKIFINLTYSCIKERGIHKLNKDLLKVLKKDVANTKYCLKLDITKFYPSIDHDVLKTIIRKKIKDKKLLILLDEIIDSSNGVPIGNYLSLFFANLILTYFDHWVKEVKHIKYYYRYADDIVVLYKDKHSLHKLLIEFNTKLAELKLKIKPNYLVFPVDSRGIDFVGYRFFHGYTLLRKSIKNKVIRLALRYKAGKISEEDLLRKSSSYFGWLKYCNSKHLLQKIEKITDLHYSNWIGKESNISNFYNKDINISEVIPHKKYFTIHLIYLYKHYTVNSKSKKLLNQIRKFININCNIHYERKNYNIRLAARYS